MKMRSQRKIPKKISLTDRRNKDAVSDHRETECGLSHNERATFCPGHFRNKFNLTGLKVISFKAQSFIQRDKCYFIIGWREGC